MSNPFVDLFKNMLVPCENVDIEHLSKMIAALAASEASKLIAQESAKWISELNKIAQIRCDSNEAAADAAASASAPLHPPSSAADADAAAAAVPNKNIIESLLVVLLKDYDAIGELYIQRQTSELKVTLARLKSVLMYLESLSDRKTV